jgi:transposase
MQDIELYKQVLGVKEPWQVTNVKLELKQRTVTIEIGYDKATPVTCPVCDGAASIYDHQARKWRHLDTCQLRTVIECKVPRASCGEHGVRLLPVAWAESKSRFTALFEALVINWLREASMSAVAELMHLSWDEVSGIQERAVKRGLKRRKQTVVKQIGIDETSFQKHHEYVTVILDRERDIVLDVLDDRKAETLKEWFHSRPARHLKAVEMVTMDMWDPFINAVKACIPDAEEKIGFDRFHVAQHFGKALDKVRAQEHRWFLGSHGDSPLVGTKFDWLKTSSLIDNRSRQEFMVLSKLNLKTARAWRIKETAAQLWDYTYRAAAETAWKSLLGWIARCRLEPVKKVGRMVKEYFWGILNAILAHVSNARSEAKNARIQHIKNRACGYRNRKRFRVAILFHLGGLDLMPSTLENFAF